LRRAQDEWESWGWEMGEKQLKFNPNKAIRTKEGKIREKEDFKKYSFGWSGQKNIHS